MTQAKCSRCKELSLLVYMKCSNYKFVYSCYLMAKDICYDKQYILFKKLRQDEAQSFSCCRLAMVKLTFECAACYSLNEVALQEQE